MKSGKLLIISLCLIIVLITIIICKENLAKYFYFKKLISTPAVTTNPDRTPQMQVTPAESLPYIFVTKWGSEGSGNGQFKAFSRIAIDLKGNIYVTDCRNHQIQIFDSNGKFITKFGSEGSGEGQFKAPIGISINSMGNIYVADTGNIRIQVFDSKGNFINKWGSSKIKGNFSIDNNTIKKLKGKISNNKLLKLEKLKHDNSCSSREAKAYKLEHLNFTSKEIELITGFNIDKDVTQPTEIAIDSDGYVYVACMLYETYDHDIFDVDGIKKFTPEGNLVSKWPVHNPQSVSFSFDKTVGIGGIAIDKPGDIYVTYYTGDRIIPSVPGQKLLHSYGVDAWISKYDNTGNFITQWGDKNSKSKSIKGFLGTGAIAIDSKNHIFIIDNYYNCIHIYDTQGNFIGKFGSEGSGDGQFNGASCIAVDSEGNLYVAEYKNHRIQKFAPNPDFKIK